MPDLPTAEGLTYYCRVTRDQETTPCTHKPCIAARDLIPNGIEQMHLNCIVCGKEVDAKRAKAGTPKRETCSSKCLEAYKIYKNYLSGLRRCPNCYRPSTPRERKLFQEWRRQTGLKGTSGRPETKAMYLLREMLAVHKAVEAGNDPEEGYIANLVSRVEKYFDTRRRKQITLAASGQPTPGE